MDIDLGRGMKGTEAAETILKAKDIPLAFLSSHTEPEIVNTTEGITSYGYIVKNSGNTVLLASIKMAFRLYEANKNITWQAMQMAASREQLRVTHEQLAWWPGLMEYVVENDLTSIAILDRDLHFLYCSRRFLEDYKVREHQIIGRHHYDVFPEIPPKWRDVHQKALKGEVLSSDDDFFYRPDGSIDYTRWECRPWYDQNGAIGGIILYTEVLTENRIQQQKLQEMQERITQERQLLQNILDSIPVLITRYDPSTNILYLNKEFENKVGWSTEEAADMDLMAAVYPDPDYREHVRQYMSQAECGWEEFEVTTRKGTILRSKWSNIQLDDGTQIGVGIDVTQLKKTEDRYKSLVENLPGIAYRYSTTRGGLFWSRQSTDIIGYGPGEITQNPNIWYESIHPDFKPNLNAILKDPANGAGYRLEYQLKTRDGNWIWISDRFISRVDLDDETIIEGFAMDITEQKEAREEILKLVHEKETLIKEVQHRIKNTMGTMGGLLYLQAESAANPETKASLHDAVNRFKSMEILYDYLYRSEDHATTPLGQYLDQLIHQQVAPQSSKIRHRVTINDEDLQLPAKLSSTLGIVVNELVTNSIKYALPENEHLDLELDILSTKKELVLTLRDNGPGLSPSVDLNNPKGFGLTLINALVQQMRGTIQIEDKIENKIENKGGARFTLTIPRP